MGIIKIFEALAVLVFLWVSITAFIFGIMEKSTFWISIAIYCKIVSYVEAYRLGWLKPDTLAVPREAQNERYTNEGSSTGVQ